MAIHHTCIAAKPVMLYGRTRIQPRINITVCLRSARQDRVLYDEERSY